MLTYSVMDPVEGEVVVTDVRASGSRKTELYSCLRCRKLKKKCSKTVPICSSCERADEQCVYPGRAPRRTKKELAEAMRRGEFVPCRRNKKSARGSKGEHEQKGCAVVRETSSDLMELSPMQTDNHREDSFGRLPAYNTYNTPGEEMDSVAQASLTAATSFLNILNLISIGQLPTPETQCKDTQRQAREGQKAVEPTSVAINATSIQSEFVLSCFEGRNYRTTGSVSNRPNVDRVLCDRFITAYFKHNHRSYPLINKLEFLQTVSQIGDLSDLDEEKHSDAFIFQLHMILAIGCTSLERAGHLSKEEGSLSEHFSRLAMQRFGSVMSLQDFETAKCLLLLGIYSFFEPQGVSSWTISGILMRLCIGLGLNKALTFSQMRRMRIFDVEMRYRAFWAFYSFERLVQISLGRSSAIHDDDISIPMPQPLYSEEREDIEVTTRIISFRRLAGKIYNELHSVGAGKKLLSITEKNCIIGNLKKEADDIYDNEIKKIRESHYPDSDSSGNISFHSSETWLSMVHAHLLTMIFRPSVLIPRPEMNSLSRLGTYCLNFLKNTYSLYKKNLLPLNWITLFRTLTICNTILFCLCKCTIDLIESKIEIHQCVEVLRHFGEKWIFAHRCADVFQNISNAILDISISERQLANMDKLTQELFGASNAYQEILDENNLNVSWGDLLL